MWKRRLLALCGMGLFLLLVIHEGTKKTAIGDRMYDRYTRPFIEASAYGVVTKVGQADLDLENVIYVTKPGKEFYYFDLNENWEKRYHIARDSPIQVGDTIYKVGGEKHYNLIKPNGKLVPCIIR
jgi:hypothetical protein